MYYVLQPLTIEPTNVVVGYIYIDALSIVSDLLLELTKKRAT